MTASSSASSATLSTFLTALVFNGAVFGAEILGFILLKPYFRRIYEPRALAREIHPLSSLGWPFQVATADYRAIIKANGLDAYFFVRFLRMLFIMFIPIWVVSWGALFPLTIIHTSVGNPDGLDKLVFGNIAPDKSIRYIGHILCAYAFTLWVFYNIRNEMRHFIITRQHHLIDSVHSKTVQANTILITGIPAKYLNQQALAKVYGTLPGGVSKIWINRNLKGLPDVHDRRVAACNKLESAETNLLRAAAKLKAKQIKEGGPAKDIDRASVPRPTHRLGFLGLFGKKVDSIDWAREEIRVCSDLLREGISLVQSADNADSVKGEQLVRDGIGGGWNNEKADVREEGDPEDGFTSREEQDHAASQGPPAAGHSKLTHTLSEASHHAAAETRHGVQQASNLTKKALAETTNAATSLLSKKGNKEYPPLNSAFITFHSQIAAHLAVQALAHHEPYRMSDRYVEMSPNDVIWGNLGLNPYEMKVRMAISWGITLALIIFWAIPVAFVGVISNIHTVCTTAKFLAWICNLPKPVVGIISGILPPVLLAVLMMLLPIVLRLLAQFEGIPQKSVCELSLMNRYFSFQVVHTFLIVALASGVTASLQSLLHSPTSVPSILATQLPLSSTFFLTYTLLQMTATAGGFLQIVRLIVYYVKLVILGSTPRSIWNLKYATGGISAWGTLWPSVTVVIVIAFAYMLISPVINGLACVTFGLLFLLYKYLFLWVLDQSSTPDTGGLFFAQGLQHIFVGLWVQQVVLAALFFLAQDENGKPSAIPEGALMIVLIFLTIAFQAVLNNSYGPLMKALPLSLADRMYVTPDIPVVSTPQDPDMEMMGPNTSKSVTSGHNIESDYLRDEHEGTGFAHPAIADIQQTIWIPTDALGWSAEEHRATEEAGITVVTGHGAVLDEKGSIQVEEEPGIPELGA